MRQKLSNNYNFFYKYFKFLNFNIFINSGSNLDPETTSSPIVN